LKIFKVGQKVKVALDKRNVFGVFPPDLSPEERVKEFEILQLSIVGETNSRSAFLTMPTNIGVKRHIDGIDKWGWYVLQDSLEELNEPQKEELNEAKAEAEAKAKAEAEAKAKAKVKAKKTKKSSASTHTFKVGDIVRPLECHRNILDSRLTDTHHSIGYPVLKVSTGQLTLELPSNIGNWNWAYSKYTNVIPVSYTELVKDSNDVVKFEDSKNVTESKHSDNVPQFKIGDKVLISEEAEFPNLIDKKLKNLTEKSFEIIKISAGLIAVKFPDDCYEAIYDASAECRIWWFEPKFIKEYKKKMETSKNRGGFMERRKSNVGKGLLKASGRKLTKITKAGILRAIEAAATANGMDGAQVQAGLKMVTFFMESEFGTAFISALLALGINFAPSTNLSFLQDERLQDLADEMESDGSAIVMEKLFEIATQYIAPGLMEVIQGLPAVEKKEIAKVRIKAETKPTTKKKRAPAHDEEDEDEEVRHHQKQVA
jgi:hypothetical protein